MDEKEIASDPLKLIVEFSSDWLMYLSANGKIQYISPAVEEITGYTPEEFIDHPGLLLRIIHPDDRERTSGKLANELKNPEPSSLVCRIVRKDGDLRWISHRGRPVFDDHRNIIGRISSNRDITERIRVERALKESEKGYRRIFETSPTTIFITSFDNQILDMNPAGIQMFGFSTLEEAKSTPVTTLYPNPTDRKKILTTLLERGVVRNYELKLKRRDGSDLTVLNTATVIYDEEHHPIAIEGILLDVTEQREQEKRLLRLATIIEQASQAIVMTDLNGNIVYVNPAFERITGYPFEKVKGKNPRILKSGKHDHEFYKNLWETIRAGDTWQGIFQNRKSDSSLYYERTVIFPIKNKSGQTTHYAAIKQDITSERMLEEQLTQAQKMETIGQLAGGIAHDFNNLLSIIKGYSEIGLLRLPKDAPGYHELSAIFDASERAETLIAQLLAFSRKQVYTPVVLDINQVISRMDKMLRRLISEDIHIETLLTPGVPPIKADPSQIEQILVNVIVNARDAIASKTNKASERKITIETQSVFLDKTYINRHFGTQEGKYVQISVSDSGIGMDEKTRWHIFEPFFTTKEKGKGTGLGLSTVFGIVKQNNGSIQVYSEPNVGTTFKIYWPVTEEAVPEEAITTSSRVLLAGKGSILFVEDEPELRKLVVTTLREYGYNVKAAADGMEALKRIQQAKEPFDLIITDLIMPAMNGDELIQRVQSLSPGIKVIFTSGYTSNHIIHNGNLEKGINFLPKPYSLSKLFHIIRKVLTQGEDT